MKYFYLYFFIKCKSSNEKLEITDFLKKEKKNEDFIETVNEEIYFWNKEYQEKILLIIFFALLFFFGISFNIVAISNEIC